jgi:D-alanyl-D-alanine carboxypeptidase
MIHVWTSLLFVCAILTSSALAIPVDDALGERLRAAVAAVCERDSIKGAAVSVRWSDDHWQGAAGFSHGDVEIEPSMLFGIGSNTKTLTSIILLRLQEEGRIDLDATIGPWFPDHPNIDTSITIRQLLQHTSGLGDYSATTAYRQTVGMDPSRILTEADILPLIPGPTFRAGTSWQYCNTNYYLAALIATKVTGTKLSELLRAYITRPLGLEQTVLAVEEDLVGEVAHRWIGGVDGFFVPINAAFSGAWAAGAVFSTASDMTLIYDRLFAGGLLGPASMEQLLDFTGPQLYGLGISQKPVGGTTIVGHSGEIRGYSSVVLRVPSLAVNIAVLTNDAQGNAVAVADTIIRILRSLPTSVDADDLGIAIGPIPAHDHLAIQGHSGTVEVLDLCGRVMMAASSPAGGRLALGSIPSGVYVVRVGRVTRLVPIHP